MREAPPEAAADPIGWTEKFIESRVPQAAVELDWQLMFGSDKNRLSVALEILGMKGISSRGPQTGQVVPAINLILPGAGLPWDQPSVPKLVEGEVVTSNDETKTIP